MRGLESRDRSFALLALLMTVPVVSSVWASEAKSPAGFDLSAYASVLKTYVNDQGQVDYKGLKANRESLDAYLSSVTRLAPSLYARWSDQGKIAFWINAYNALTLKAIIDNYPIQSSFLASLRFPKNSIRQISGVWDKQEHTVMRQQRTLDDIEHRVLRAEFGEPRIHMALVCASVGCPVLRQEPYSGERLDAQLEDQTRRFLKDPGKFRVNRGAGQVSISPIFDWFGKDFVKSYGAEEGFSGHDEVERATLNFISRHLDEDEGKYLASGRYDLEYLDYDWSLNEQ